MRHDRECWDSKSWGSQRQLQPREPPARTAGGQGQALTAVPAKPSAPATLPAPAVSAVPGPGSAALAGQELPHPRSHSSLCWHLFEPISEDIKKKVEMYFFFFFFFSTISMWKVIRLRGVSQLTRESLRLCHYSQQVILAHVC